MAEPTVPPTSLRRALAAFGVGAVIGFLTWHLLLAVGWSLPVLGASAWLVSLLAALLIGWQVGVVRRERRRPYDHDPAVALTRVRLAQASIVVGLLLAGGYGSLVVAALPGWPAPLIVDRVVHGGLATVAALCWAGAGGVLEWQSRIPRRDDEHDEPASRLKD